MIILNVWENQLDAFEKFKEFKALVKKGMDKSISCLGSNDGLKYCPKNFDKFCTLERIKHQNTPPYTPQQKGVPKQMNRTIMEHARSMLNISISF